VVNYSLCPEEQFKMDAFYILLVLVAGACAPAQAGINSLLVRFWAGNAILAAMISFAVGTIALVVAVLVLRIPWPAIGKVAHLPWWLWTGGLMGACLVTTTVAAAPILGAATMIGVMVAGQMVTSLFLDHWGLVGYTVHPINIPRIIGAALLVIGVILLKKF
jgi:bacterial/archaeal transporter family-2 protein